MMKLPRLICLGLMSDELACHLRVYSADILQAYLLANPRRLGFLHATAAGRSRICSSAVAMFNVVASLSMP